MEHIPDKVGMLRFQTLEKLLTVFSWRFDKFLDFP
jgi:hypothetical protein